MAKTQLYSELDHDNPSWIKKEGPHFKVPEAVVVLSGGMDSATALGWAKKHPTYRVKHALHFNYGSKHARQEGFAAAKIANFYGVPITVIPLEFIGKHFKSDLLESGGDIPEGHYEDPSMRATVVPFRNGIMLSIAAGFAESIGAEVVILGNHAGDHAVYPDCRGEFIIPMARAIAMGTYIGVKLESPFCDITKEEIVRMGAGLRVPYQHTWSCYKGGNAHCGKCGTCFERREAFQKAGVEDPTRYE